MIINKWNLKPWTLYKRLHPEYDGKPKLESVRKPVSRISNGSLSWQSSDQHPSTGGIDDQTPLKEIG